MKEIDTRSNLSLKGLVLDRRSKGCMKYTKLEHHSLNNHFYDNQRVVSGSLRWFGGPRRPFYNNFA